jgi:hypothetical protein
MRKPAVFPFKVAGSPKVLLAVAFWPIFFLRVRPMFYLGLSMAKPRLKCEKSSGWKLAVTGPLRYHILFLLCTKRSRHLDPEVVKEKENRLFL